MQKFNNLISVFMGNEVNNKKVILSDDELKQVVGGVSDRPYNKCNYTTRHECESVKGICSWHDGVCKEMTDGVFYTVFDGFITDSDDGTAMFV